MLHFQYFVIIPLSDRYMNSIERYFWPFAVSVFFILCACSTQPVIPKGFPKEEAMARILADLYLAEATMNSYPYGYKENLDFKSAGYYKDVLAKYQLSKQDFDTILSWYTSEPYLYAKVYDRVISILGTREADLKNALLMADSMKIDALELEKQKALKGNLWRGASKIVLPRKDSLSIEVAFDIDLDSLKGGVLDLEARYRFGRGNQISKAMMVMLVSYADSSVDSTKFELERSFKEKISKVSIALSEAKQAVAARGSLLEFDTLKKVFVEIDEIKLNHLPSKHIPMEMMLSAE